MKRAEWRKREDRKRLIKKDELRNIEGTYKAL